MLGEKSHYAVQLNRLFLTPIGVWPIGRDAPLVQRLLKRLAIIGCYLLMSYLLVPTALHTFLEEPDPAIKLKLIGPMSFHLMAIGKYVSLVGRTEEISACFEHVEEDWKMYSDKNAKPELEMMKRNAKIGRFLIYLCAAFMYGGGFFYHMIMPLSVGRLVTKQVRAERYLQLVAENASTDNIDVEPVRVLSYPIYGLLAKLDYVTLLLVQFVAGFVLYTITIASCSLAAVFANHVCGQLEIVMSLLRDFVHDNEDNPRIYALADDAATVERSRSDKFAEIVQRHLRALNFASRVEKNLNAICFVEFIGCTLNICFLEYYFITEWENQNTVSTMTYCILLISFIFNIFIFCYIGELLTEQSKKIGEVTYAINWYTLSGKRAVDLIMIIMIASCYPARITAGKMVNLSLGSFCNVIKTSATYLNLLRTMML